MVYITVLRIASLPLEDLHLDIFFDNFYWPLFKPASQNIGNCRGQVSVNVWNRRKFQNSPKTNEGGNGKARSTVTIATISALQSGKDQIARKDLWYLCLLWIYSPIRCCYHWVKIKQEAISSFEVYTLQENYSSICEEMLRCLANVRRMSIWRLMTYLWPLFSVNLLIKTFFVSIWICKF